MSEHKPAIPPLIHKCDALNSEWLHEVMCPECQVCDIAHKVMPADLIAFTVRVLEHYGVATAEAELTAQNLVSADERGVASHGVARLGRYLTGLRAGYIRPGVRFEVTEPAPATATIDAKHGLGQVAGEAAMDLAIAKAEKGGIGVVTVKNSNHYGIAGYYVLKALEKGLLGISMTNAAPLVIPTNGAHAILGTNPIAFGAPAGSYFDFLLDTATSVVPRGKLEVYDRKKEQMPIGWSVDEKGFDCQNPGRVLKNLLERVGGGILPLGGRGEEFGGHKGFGFALMVDVLCGVLSGSSFGPDVNNLKRSVPRGEVAAPQVGHFFLALDISHFMPLAEFKERLDTYIELIKNSPTALDQEQIFIHGEKEYLRAQMHRKSGIPLTANVFDTLVRIARECDVPGPLTVADRNAGEGV